MTIRTFYLNSARTAFMKAYLLDRVENVDWGEKRPAVLVCPGGGYQRCSTRESEPIAMHYLAKGFNAFVLNYEVNRRFPAAFSNAAYAMYQIKSRAKEFGIDRDKVAVWGASAGGHLAGCLSTMFSDANITRAIGCGSDDLRPAAAVLCYPVISGITSPHKGSFEILLGENAHQSDLARLSLENRVTPKTPPTFLWCTADDDAVSAHNSLAFAKACISNNVPLEMHIYDSGPHGLSDCSKNTGYNKKYYQERCKEWVSCSVKFLEKHLNT